MADLSDATLQFILEKAKTIHHGAIMIHFNADAKDQVLVEVVEKQKFRTDDRVESAPRPVTRAQTVPGGRENRRNG